MYTRMLLFVILLFLDCTQGSFEAIAFGVSVLQSHSRENDKEGERDSVAGKVHFNHSLYSSHIHAM